MSQGFTIGAAFVRAPRMIGRRKGAFAALIGLEAGLYVLLAAIQFAVVMPMMMRQAVDPQPFSVIGLMAAFLVVGLVWMAMSESAWHRLLTGREAGAFPYRLSADELRMAGCWLLVVLASLILHSPLIAFVVWTAMHADGFPWAALWMLPLSWAISLAVFSRAAPLVPWAIVHRRFRPLSVLRASGAVWGKVALTHILLVLGLFGAWVLVAIVLMPFMVVIGAAGAVTGGDPTGAIIVMQVVNTALNMVVTFALLALTRGIAAEAALSLPGPDGEPVSPPSSSASPDVPGPAPAGA
jgi:hypothetical protein